jgi:HAD superfamily hydrolase (TIGR01509 family)
VSTVGKLGRSADFGALFDWDGVVIDSSAQHEKSWQLLARETAKTLPPDHFLRGFGMKNQRIIPEILCWTEDPDEIEEYSLRKEHLYREIILEEGIRPLPGAAELLRTLAERGVPCAVASSTHRRNVEVVVDAIGLRHCFQAIVTGEDVSRGKPDPEVFLESARRIGRAAANCVVFEDAHVGIEAGLAAGARVIAVATTHPLEDLGRAHFAVRSLEEVRWEDFTAVFG